MSKLVAAFAKPKVLGETVQSDKRQVKGKFTDSEYYMTLLYRLSAEIKKTRPSMQKNKVRPLSYKLMKMMVKLSELLYTSKSLTNTLVARSDFQQLLTISKKDVSWKEICFRWRSNIQTEAYFHNGNL